MAFFQLEKRARSITKDDKLTDASAFEGTLDGNPINLEYPSDLLSDTSSYGNAFTAFFISVHADEELAKTVNLTQDTYYVKDRKSGSMAQMSQKYGEGLVNTSVSLAVGGATAYTRYKVSSSPILGALTKGLGTGFAVGAATAIGGNNTGYKQQKACIILPTPNLDSNYNFTWDSNTNMILGGLVEGIGDVVNNTSSGGLASKILGAFKSAKTSALGAVSATTYKMPGIGDTVSRLNGYSPNPRKEQIFREPNFRQFSFTYTFAPRSKEEARNVEAIIRQFKYHAHPSLGMNNFCYRYPSEFDIVHYHNNEENLHLPKHATSVLESVSVNYAPSDNYSFFADGMPSVIQMTLRFVELGIITKEDIRKGY